jgi:exonuclease SbcC
VIITSIKATNVLQYDVLDIPELPEQGLIAVSGFNESGKSAIGETICFALFGRTFSIMEGELDKIIRWGMPECSVTLSFRVGEIDYVLWRLLDTEGNHSASLSLAQDPEQALARGAKAVANTLVTILGYEFEEFIESFYLAQREISTPHPHSQAIKVMAGVAPLECISAEFKADIESQSDELQRFLDDIDSTRKDIDALDIQTGKLEDLEQRQADVQQTHASHTSWLHDLRQSVESYSKHVPLIHQAKSSWRVVMMVGFLSLLITVVTGASWGLMSYAGELPLSVRLHEIFQQYLPGWHVSYIDWVGIAAVAFAVTLLLSWLKLASLNKRITHLQAEAANLADSLARLPARSAEAHAQAVDESPVTLRPGQAEYVAAHAGISAISTPVAEAREYSARETGWLEQQLGDTDSRLAELAQDISHERALLEQSNKLTVIAESAEEKHAALLHRTDCERKAIELLASASVHLANNFNRKVRELAANSLPQFTESRYEYLQIDEDLNVRVFSNEKKDFMSLEEVSSGTQRQIMLALRLALSHELSVRTGKGPQFVFLDEPFAFFDAVRTSSSLNALAGLDEQLSQIWVVAQSFTEEQQSAFTMMIDCNLNQESVPGGYINAPVSLQPAAAL